MTIAPGTNIYPAMSLKRVLERFPVGAGVTSTWADRSVGTVTPAGVAPEGAAAQLRSDPSVESEALGDEECRT